jgi:hypothetical protein
MLAIGRTRQILTVMNNKMIKQILTYTIALLLTATNFGCNKEKKLSITYPAKGVYGENVLSLDDNSTLNSVNGYSLCAELGKKAELKIVITNLSVAGTSGPGAVWFYAQEDGWLISDYTDNSQQFESNKDGKLDLDLIFKNGPGSCRVDYYENSSSVTNSKTFTW